MAQSIKTLLSKKGWTGKEVGKALLTNLAHDIKNKGTQYEPLFSQTDLDRMIESLNTEAQYTAFKVYSKVYEAVVESFNKNQASIQQFYNGYYRYLLHLKGAMDADRALQNMEQYPMIMTKRQYDRLKQAQARKKRAYKASFRDLIFDLLQYFMETPQDAPESIREAIAQTRNERVRNKRILADYNQDMGEGYFVLKDGRRSDEMTPEQWDAALSEVFMQNHTLILNGEPATEAETELYYNQDRYVRACRILFSGEEGIKAAYKAETGTDLHGGVDDITHGLEAIVEGREPAPWVADTINLLLHAHMERPTWHYNDQPPADLTKYDILQSLLEKYNGSAVDSVGEREQFKEFQRDYPAVYASLKAFIEAKVPAAQGLKASQFFKSIVTWGELADIPLPCYESMVLVKDREIAEQFYAEEDTTRDLQARRRIAYHGIAILSDEQGSQVDDSGDYRPPESPYDALYNLDKIAADEAETAMIQGYLSILVVPALRYIFAFNAFVDIIASVYDAGIITAAKEPMTYQCQQIDALNDLIYLFYQRAYGTDAEKQRKRALIREIFSPLDVESLKPSQDAINEIQTALSTMGYTHEAVNALNDWQGIVAKLMGEGA